MKTTFLTYFLLCTLSANSQNKKKTFTDDRSVKIYYARKGDIITFRCDSVLLLNKPSYHAWDSSYAQLHTNFYQLAAMNDSSQVVSKELFESKSRQYAELNASFTLLHDSATNHVQFLNSRMEGMQADLLHTKDELTNATQSIQVATTQLGKARSQKWKDKITGGLIGFGLASSLFLFIK